MEQLEPAFAARLEDITEETTDALEETPEHLWKVPVREITQPMAKAIEPTENTKNA